MDRWQALCAMLAVSIASGLGCRTAVRDFASLNDPAPFVRARAAGLDAEAPDAVAIPALIEHLDDPDAVVRLSSHEALRQRTGQDFGYTPYGSPEDRSEAIGRWRAWWQSQADSSSGRRLPQEPGAPSRS